MNVFRLILAVFALVFLILAAAGVRFRRVDPFPLGMACWLLVVVFWPLL